MNNSQFIQNDKFITDYSYIARVIPFDFLKGKSALINIYCAVILKSLKRTKGAKAFHDFMHSNYGANLTFRRQLLNEYFYLGLKFEVINKKYLPDNYDAFASLVNFAHDALFSEPEFDEEIVERNKKELISYIRKQDKTPQIVCYRNVYKQLDPDHLINFDHLGTIEEVQNVNVQALLDFHHEILKYPLTYIYQGENDFNQYELLKSTFKDNFELPLYKDNPIKDREYIYGETKMDSLNTSLMMVYHFDLPYSLKNSYILHYFDKILGGYNSILFNEIREKRGLCYSIYSLCYTSENVCEISTQISKDNIKYTMESIEEIISHFEDYFDEDYFYKAKMDLKASIIQRFDNGNDLFSHNLILLYKRNRLTSYDLSLEVLDSITREDIINFAKTLKLVSAYVAIGDK